MGYVGLGTAMKQAWREHEFAEWVVLLHWACNRGISKYPKNLDWFLFLSKQDLHNMSITHPDKLTSTTMCTWVNWTEFCTAKKTYFITFVPPFIYFHSIITLVFVKICLKCFKMTLEEFRNKENGITTWTTWTSGWWDRGHQSVVQEWFRRSVEQLGNQWGWEAIRS